MKKNFLLLSIMFTFILLFTYDSFNLVSAESTDSSTAPYENLNFPLNTANTTEYTGKGVKIAILDSGVCIEHPDLKDKIIGGYDFVEDKPIYMDGDLRKAHGTHVAGIAAANGKMKGIASEASLLIYRVVPKENDANKIHENIIKAIKRAIEDGAEVINISASIDNYKQNDALDNEIKNARKRGIIVVKSNGNTGPNNWTTSNLASSPDVISVGNATLPSKQPILKDKNGEVVLKLGDESSPFSMEGKVNYLGTAQEKDLNQTSLKNKIAIMNMTGKKIDEKEQEILSLVRKLKSSEAHGLILLGVDTNVEAYSFLYEGLPIAFVKTKDVDKFNAMIKSGDSQLTSKLYQDIFSQSSRGPGNDTLLLKPDISAPGTKILSTSANDGYVYNTGTSMSAPYITGTIALIKQAHNTWGFDEIKAALINNADILKDDENKTISFLSQGSGVVNIEKAVHADNFLICNNLSFSFSNETEIEKTAEITLKNVSDSTKQYNISVEKLSEFTGIDIDVPTNISADKNSSNELLLKVKIGKNTPKGIYEGVLWFKNNTEEKHLPFMILAN